MIQTRRSRSQQARSLRTRIAAALAAAGLCGAGASALAAFDIPTGAPPSPLFGAQPFTQKLLMFEEFGTQPLPANAPAHALPSPLGCDGPANPAIYGGQLDAFLGQPLFPAPTRTANTALPNPWAATISGCLGRPVTGVLEGRPPGEAFSHQRWNEFQPEIYFQTAMAGARPNGGLRDSLQLHRYQSGEFGPGGLYHDTTGTGLNGTTAGITIKFHPNMPVQSPLNIWTFDGTLPPKLLMATYDRTILNRHYNALPISDAANAGFGRHTISTHEHNGHNPAESDGFAGAFFFPGQFYDYRWPMIVAGHDAVNAGKTDPRAGTPACADPRPGFCNAPGGIRNMAGDWREIESTHWFHDHMVDFTAQNVYKGNAAMMNYYSSVDRGREPASAAEAVSSNGYGCNYANPSNPNLCFPSGSDLDWGNRSYDVNLVVADKAFDAQGQLWFNTFQTDGFLGDVMTVNFLYKPYLDVRARKYRFRILNGAVSRYVKIALVQQVAGNGGQYQGPPGSGVSYNQVPFHMVGNDGNIMAHAVPFPNVQSPEGLPEQSIAERDDIIVDFARFAPGTKLYFVNLLEHANGKTPKQAIPIAQVLSGEYSVDGCPDSCDPAVGQFMELRVQAWAGTDRSMNPADYEEGKKAMIPLPGFTPAELANAKERTFVFNRGGDVAPWTISTDGGRSFNATAVEGLFNRVSAAPEMGSVEIWHIKNGGNGWAHPVHIHFEEGQILQRGGVAPPIWEKGARKDMYRIGPTPDSTDSVDVAIRVRDFLGTYVEHCHNTQHEDHAMLLRWDSQNPGQTVAIPTPFPSWDGVSYVASNTTDVPTFKTGRQTDFLTKVAAPVAANDAATTVTGVAVKIPVLANDSCVGGCDPASLTIGTAPANGSAVRNTDGTVTYTSAAGFIGTNTFTYTVRDTTTGTQISNPATVTVNVIPGPPPNPPVAVNDAATTPEGTVVGINLIANDSNCPPCTVAIVAPPLNGTVSANTPAAGQVTYTPNVGFNGTDVFTYTATNAGGTSAPANVSVTVTAVNDAPVANDDTASTVAASPVSINVLANDTDADGPFPLTVVNLTQPAAGTGTVALNADGTVTYSPGAFTGPRTTFTYQVRDGLGAQSNIATVTVNVGAVDYDIVRLTVPAAANRNAAITPQLVLVNSGTVRAPRTARISATRFPNVPIYNQTVTVNIAPGAQQTVSFPSVSSAVAGTIVWNASVTDDVPDADTANASTVIR